MPRASNLSARRPLPQLRGRVYSAGGRRLLDLRALGRISPIAGRRCCCSAIVRRTTPPSWRTWCFASAKRRLAFPAMSLSGDHPAERRKTPAAVPHRPGVRSCWLGLVNVRGELYPCVSLHADFQESPAACGGLADVAVSWWRARARPDWVFPGRSGGTACTTCRLARSEPLPTTLDRAADITYARDLLRTADKDRRDQIDDERLFGSLTRRTPRERSRRLLDVGPLPRRGLESQMRVLRRTDRLALERGEPPKGTPRLGDACGALDQSCCRPDRAQLDDAVALSHAMEDCLVAAQEGVVTLAPAASIDRSS